MIGIVTGGDLLQRVGAIERVILISKGKIFRGSKISG